MAQGVSLRYDLVPFRGAGGMEVLDPFGPSWRTQAGTGTDQWRPLEGGPLAEGCKIPLP